MAKVLIGNFKGPKGDKGDKGDTGTAASIQVGTTQTVQPGENAEVNNTGTTTAAVLNFKIPRGEDGMTDLTAEYKDASEYTCQPTVNAPVVVKRVDGKTEQVETTGAQLFDAENTTWNVNSSSVNYEKTETGVNFTTIINLGNAGVYAAFAEIDSEKTYTISFDITVSDKNFSNIMLGINDDSNNTLNINTSDFTENVPYHVDLQLTEAQNQYFVIYINNNGYSVGTTVTVENIMLAESQDEVPWEPYTGGSPAPSPDYPQAIKGVGGMGYFDGEWRQGVYQAANGTWQAAGNGICSQNPINAKAGDNVTLKYPDEAALVILAYKNDGTYLGNNAAQNAKEVSYTLPTDTAYVHIDVQMAQGVSFTPSTAKYCTVTINGEYQTEIKSRNINLWNGPEQYTGSVQISSTFDWTGKDEIYIEFDALTDNTDGQIVVYLYYYNENGTKVGRNGFSQKVPTSFTHFSVQFDGKNSVNGAGKTDLTKIKRMTAILEIYQNSASEFSVKNVMFSDEQLTDVTYVSHKEFTLTIPLTSPLYEGDKICYVKPGESYVNADGDTVVADRILYGVYRENATVVFDGSEDEAWKDYTDETFRGFKYTIKNMKKSNFNDGFCDLFFVEKEVSNNNPGIWLGSTAISTPTSDMFVHNVNPTYATDVNNWKTWLQSHNMTVLYPIATPYFEPFPDQSIFYNLRTADTLTYIYSSDPIEPVLTVEVAKNSTGGYLLESYAQAQKNAISEANSQSRISAIEQQLVNQATTPTE